MEILFSKRIRELRLGKGLKQIDIAKHLDVAENTVSQWETGIFEPNYKTLAMLAKFFGETTDYLLGLTD